MDRDPQPGTSKAKTQGTPQQHPETHKLSKTSLFKHAPHLFELDQDAGPCGEDPEHKQRKDVIRTSPFSVSQDLALNVQRLHVCQTLPSSIVWLSVDFRPSGLQSKTPCFRKAPRHCAPWPSGFLMILGASSSHGFGLPHPWSQSGLLVDLHIAFSQTSVGQLRKDQRTQCQVFPRS